MNIYVHIGIQIILTALQFFVPAFFTLTPNQDAAIHGFVSAVQTLLATLGHLTDPNKLPSVTVQGSAKSGMPPVNIAGMTPPVPPTTPPTPINRNQGMS